MVSNEVELNLNPIKKIKDGIKSVFGAILPQIITPARQRSPATSAHVCKVTTNLNFERVFYTANFEVNFLKIGTKTPLGGWTDDINVEVTISYDKKIDSLSLDKLIIHSMEPPRLKVHGDGILMDSVSNFLIQSGVKVFKRTHKFLLEKVIRSLFGKRIPESDLMKQILGDICH